MSGFMKRYWLLSVVLVAAVTAGGFFVAERTYTVPVLMYHHIGEEMDSTLYVSQENFTRQMAYLKKKGYTVISLDELVNGISAGRKAPRKTVVITFDDGYLDNYLYAYPVLREQGFPATIFLISNLVGNDPDYLTWPQANMMLRDGLSFGGHTRHNMYLPGIIDPVQLIDEIAGCKTEIEENLGQPIDYYCYPTGGFTAQVKRIVRESGYKGACTTNRGASRLNTDVYELKRVKVTNADMNKPFSFRAKLSGYYNLFRSTKRGG